MAVADAEDTQHPGQYALVMGMVVIAVFMRVGRVVIALRMRALAGINRGMGGIMLRVVMRVIAMLVRVVMRVIARQRTGRRRRMSRLGS